MMMTDCVDLYWRNPLSAGWAEAMRDAGVTHAWLKASQGPGLYHGGSHRGFRDPKLADRYAEAAAAGLHVGAYHYMVSGSVVEQAEYFVDAVRSAVGDAPCAMALDVEGDGGPHTRDMAEQCRAVVEAFTGGQPCWLYIGWYYALEVGYTLDDLHAVPWWLPWGNTWQHVVTKIDDHCYRAGRPDLAGRLRPAIWQHSVAAFPGADAPIDLDRIIDHDRVARTWAPAQEDAAFMPALTAAQQEHLYRAVTGHSADGSGQTDDCIDWSVRYLRQEILGNEVTGKVHPYPALEAMLARHLAPILDRLAALEALLASPPQG